MFQFLLQNHSKIGGYLEQMEEQLIFQVGDERIIPMQLMSTITEICLKVCFFPMKYLTFAR